MSTNGPAILHEIPTPDGPFTIIANERGEVLASGWSTDTVGLASRIHPSVRPEHLVAGTSEAAQAVVAYYDGDESAVRAVPVRHGGTELQQRGWSALREIPPGRPVTYTELAALLGRPSAVRAAASICARNATGLFVPCHRVLRSDGALGGFAWGTEIKRSLLDRELGLQRPVYSDGVRAGSGRRSRKRSNA